MADSYHHHHQDHLAANNGQNIGLEHEMYNGDNELDDPQYYRHWLTKRSHYSLYFIAIYVIFVFGGQAFMRNRKPLPLSRAFLVWNLFLSLFSVVGTFSIFPEFIRTFVSQGFYKSYCKTTDEYYQGRNGYWVYLFHVSKLLELGDTVFLIGRKRPVIFLHWYHHVTVLAYTWLTYKINQGPSRWGIAMNFFIHAIMYTYYAAKSARLRCPKFLAPFITTLQLLQFVIGTFVCSHSLYVYVTKGQGSCDVALGATSVSILIYFSYFLLFAKFFYQSYVDKTSSTNKLIEKRPQQQQHSRQESNGHVMHDSSTKDFSKQHQRNESNGSTINHRRKDSSSMKSIGDQGRTHRRLESNGSISAANGLTHRRTESNGSCMAGSETKADKCD